MQTKRGMFNITVEKICQYGGYSWKRFWLKELSKKLYNLSLLQTATTSTTATARTATTAKTTTATTLATTTAAAELAAVVAAATATTATTATIPEASTSDYNLLVPRTHWPAGHGGGGEEEDEHRDEGGLAG